MKRTNNQDVNYINAQQDKIQSAINFVKAHCSLAHARILYAIVFRTEAPGDKTYSSMATEVYHKIGPFKMTRMIKAINRVGWHQQGYIDY